LNGRRVLSAGGRDLDFPVRQRATAFDRFMPGPPMGYGYHGWALRHAPTGIHAGPSLAIGVLGQCICIHPIAQVVTVIQVRRQGADVETLSLLRAAVCAP
jgi:hypothetical protein